MASQTHFRYLYPLPRPVRQAGSRMTLIEEAVLAEIVTSSCPPVELCPHQRTEVAPFHERS